VFYVAEVIILSWWFEGQRWRINYISRSSVRAVFVAGTGIAHQQNVPSAYENQIIAALVAQMTDLLQNR
jgi:hypothetical protein